MSLESWKQEFYPVEARDVLKASAIDHSLQKWKGLRSEKLAQHGISPASMEDAEFVCGASCALCTHYLEPARPHLPRCTECPLYQIRGGFPCDVETPSEIESPYSAWGNGYDPEPMIALLEQAAELERQGKL